MSESSPDCARCPYPYTERLCNTPEGKGRPSCPTLHKETLLQQSMQVYEDPATSEFARQATIQEGQGYESVGPDSNAVKPVKPRILEIVEFAHKMNYQRVGLVFCEGLVPEARKVERFFAKAGFVMVSVACKVGRTDKETIGVRDDQKICPGSFEPMCNPVHQADILNQEKTQFNVVMGLCVGHDSLVFQHSKAPCTVLAVKDRVMGHNPLAAVYQLDTYYGFLKKQTSDSRG